MLRSHPSYTQSLLHWGAQTARNTERPEREIEEQSAEMEAIHSFDVWCDQCRECIRISPGRLERNAQFECYLCSAVIEIPHAETVAERIRTAAAAIDELRSFLDRFPMDNRVTFYNGDCQVSQRARRR